MNLLLYLREVTHHALGVEFLRLTVDGNYPIMAMQACALTGVREVKAMAA